MPPCFLHRPSPLPKTGCVHDVMVRASRLLDAEAHVDPFVRSITLEEEGVVLAGDGQTSTEGDEGRHPVRRAHDLLLGVLPRLLVGQPLHFSDACSGLPMVLCFDAEICRGIHTNQRSDRSISSQTRASKRS